MRDGQRMLACSVQGSSSPYGTENTALNSVLSSESPRGNTSQPSPQQQRGQVINLRRGVQPEKGEEPKRRFIRSPLFNMLHPSAQVDQDP
mmetsp:Transcript_24322/g.49281  ORF Transcript_24322/g.49281 Transcript_24322/m.49281 type:complete len:90 (-) Transcript_24322:80-349(-)